jgi:hypothetical protein
LAWRRILKEEIHEELAVIVAIIPSLIRGAFA